MKIDDETILSAYLDGELPADQRVRVESALLADPDLVDKLRRLVTVRDMVANLSRPELPHDLSRRVVSQIANRRAVMKRRFFARADLLPAFGAAAVILVAVILGVRIAPVLRAPQRRDVQVVAVGSNRLPTVANAGQKEDASRALETERPKVASNRGASTKRALAAGSHDEAEAIRLREQKEIRELLDNPNLRRVLIVTDVLGGSASSQVDSLVRKTPRVQADYGRISVSQGIVIDPRHPGQATVFAMVMNDRELKQFEKKLAAEFPGAVEQTAADPGVVTQLSDIGQIALLPGTSATELLPAVEEPSPMALKDQAKEKDKAKPPLRQENLEEFDGMPIRVVDAPPAVNPDEPVTTTDERKRSGPHPSTLGPKEGESAVAGREGENGGVPLAVAEESLPLLLPRKDASIVLVWVASNAPASTGNP